MLCCAAAVLCACECGARNEQTVERSRCVAAKLAERRIKKIDVFSVLVCLLYDCSLTIFIARTTTCTVAIEIQAFWFESLCFYTSIRDRIGCLLCI